MSFFGTLQMFSQKNALKHKEFRLFDKIERNGGEITFYNICAREGRILRSRKNEATLGKEENNKTTTKKERKMNAISRRHGNGGAKGGRKTMKKEGEKGTKAKKAEEHEKKEKKEAEEQRRTRMEKRNNMELLYIGGEETPPHKERGKYRDMEIKTGEKQKNASKTTRFSYNRDKCHKYKIKFIIKTHSFTFGLLTAGFRFVNRWLSFRKPMVFNA